MALADIRLMNRLLGLIKQRFLIKPAVNVYMQAITNQYLEVLIQAGRSALKAVVSARD